ATPHRSHLVHHPILFLSAFLSYRPALWWNLTGTLRFCQVARRGCGSSTFPSRTLQRNNSQEAQSPMSALVISRHNGAFTSCPLYPQKRTFFAAGGMSEKCH